MNLDRIKYYFIIMLLIAVIGFLIWFFVFRPKGEGYINVSRSAVIKEMRSLQRLETASFTVEKIIDAGTAETNIFRKFLFGDRILLIAHGQSIAGFDLSQISERDVEVQGANILVRLPAPQILITALDNTQTRVYDKQQGLLRMGEDNLESEAREAAEAAIRDAACAGGILQHATDNARKHLTSLFYALEFTTVSIEIPAGSC